MVEAGTPLIGAVAASDWKLRPLLVVGAAPAPDHSTMTARTVTETATVTAAIDPEPRPVQVRTRVRTPQLLPAVDAERSLGRRRYPPLVQM